MSDRPRYASSRLPIKVEIRRYPGVQECDVVVASRNRELVVTCPDYERALRWANIECRSYKIAPISPDAPAAINVA